MQDLIPAAAARPVDTCDKAVPMMSAFNEACPKDADGTHGVACSADQVFKLGEVEWFSHCAAFIEDNLKPEVFAAITGCPKLDEVFGLSHDELAGKMKEIQQRCNRAQPKPTCPLPEDICSGKATCMVQCPCPRCLPPAPPATVCPVTEDICSRKAVCVTDCPCPRCLPPRASMTCAEAMEGKAKFEAVCPKDCDGDDTGGEWWTFGTSNSERCKEEYGGACRTAECADFIRQHFNKDTVGGFAQCPQVDAEEIAKGMEHVKERCLAPPPLGPKEPECPSEGKANPFFHSFCEFPLVTYNTDGTSTGKGLVYGHKWEHKNSEANNEWEGYGAMLPLAALSSTVVGDHTSPEVPRVVFDHPNEHGYAALRDGHRVLAMESHGGVFEANNRVSFWGVPAHQDWAQKWKMDPQHPGFLIPERNPNLCIGWGPHNNPNGGSGEDELILKDKHEDGACLLFMPPTSVAGPANPVAILNSKLDAIVGAMNSNARSLEQVVVDKLGAIAAAVEALLGGKKGGVCHLALDQKSRGVTQFTRGFTCVPLDYTNTVVEHSGDHCCAGEGYCCRAGSVGPAACDTTRADNGQCGHRKLCFPSDKDVSVCGDIGTGVNPGK